MIGMWYHDGGVKYCSIMNARKASMGNYQFYDSSFAKLLYLKYHWSLPSTYSSQYGFDSFQILSLRLCNNDPSGKAKAESVRFFSFSTIFLLSRAKMDY